MYISLNWLKDFVKIPAKIKPTELAEAITRHTVEVEGVVRQADQYDKVVVGKVLEVKPHPKADRLRLTVVDVKKKILNIVCGAPNVAAGQFVPVALVGAVLPNGLEIKEAEIRGEKSEGMICAEDELGLGKDHTGIIVLKPEAKIGQLFAEYLEAEDIILEMDNKSLSNRPDLWGHYGLAREVAAIFDLPLKPYEKFLDKKFAFLSAKENKLEVKVEDKALCPRYLAVKIDNLKTAESPAWLKERLIAVGQRPISNLVDLTNYVMLETGQPLHAFNADKVKKIVVRRAKKNETMETLDEKERVLTDSDLLITDGHRPIALAGVMGGRESGIDAQTTSLILEAANFTAAGIRRTAQRLAMRSEASARFEKSLDPNLAEQALGRFLTLLKEICPDMKIASALADVNNTSAKAAEIDLDLDWLANKIGQEIPHPEAAGILKRLGFTIADESAAVWKVGVPSWRATKDVAAREDLAEEILRLYGYDRIVSQLPVMALAVPEANEERALERRIKSILALKLSLAEVYNYSFLSEDQLTKLDIDFSNYLRLANPLSEAQVILRSSLAPGLVYNARNNQAKAETLGFFEIGNVFFKAPGQLKKDASDETLPHQEKHLGLILAQDNDPFENLKSAVSGLLEELFGRETTVEFLSLENAPGWADGKAAAKIAVAGKEIGLVARLGEIAAANLNLKKSAAAAEINFSNLLNLILSLPTRRFQEPAKYPPVIRDLAFVLDEKILYNNVSQEILGFSPLVRSAEIFDVYSGDKLPAGEKSLAFHLLYQADDRTLITEEVDKIQAGLVERLAKKFGAKLRDF